MCYVAKSDGCMNSYKVTVSVPMVISVPAAPDHDGAIAVAMATVRDEVRRMGIDTGDGGIFTLSSEDCGKD